MQVVRIAVNALMQNMLRTGLAMLGLVIGVSAVIAMVALGTGAQGSVDAQIRAGGTNMVTVRAGSVRRGGVQFGAGAATTLTADDARAIRDRVQGVQYLSAGVTSREQVVAAGKNWSTTIQGVDTEYPLIRHWPVALGDFFTEENVAGAQKVVVLGAIVRDELFGPEVDPVGEILRIRNQVFRVVGVLSVKGTGVFSGDQDDAVFVPYTTLQKKLLGGGTTRLEEITISASSSAVVDSVTEQVSAVLRIEHGLIQGQADDFTVNTLADMARVQTQATTTMTALLATIAGVSLLVGGIGIMNIMLVSVTERTREIGLRLAVGAPHGHILLQFLTEAVLLSVLGGAIGVALGYVASSAVTRFLLWPTEVAPVAVAAAAVFSVATGILFGFYPALKASNLEPIVALYSE